MSKSPVAAVQDKKTFESYASLNTSIFSFNVKWVPASSRCVTVGKSSGDRGSLSIYKLETASLSLVQEILVPRALKCCSFGASNIYQRHVSVGDFNGGLNIWDLENLESPVFRAEAHQGIVNSVSGAGLSGTKFGAPEIATAGSDGKIKLWDVRHKEGAVREFQNTASSSSSSKPLDCWAISFCESKELGDRYICGGYDNGDVVIFDLTNGEMIWKTNVGFGVTNIDFQGTNMVVSTLNDIHLFSSIKNIITKNKNSEASKDEEKRNQLIFGQHAFTSENITTTVWDAQFLPSSNGTRFVTVDGNSTVKLWDNNNNNNKNKNKNSYDNTSKKENDDNNNNSFNSSSNNNNNNRTDSSSNHKDGSSQQSQKMIQLEGSYNLGLLPITSFDLHPDKPGLMVCSSLDKSLNVLFTPFI